MARPLALARGASTPLSVGVGGGREAQLKPHTQPTAGGRTLVNADRIKATRIGDPRRPRSNRARPPTADQAIHASDGSSQGSTCQRAASFNLFSSLCPLSWCRSGAYAGPPAGARVIAHALNGGWGAPGCEEVVAEGGREAQNRLHTQPTAGSRTLVDADRIKAARIGDPLGVDLTERAFRPLIRLSTHSTVAAGAVRVREPRPSTSSFFDLELERSSSSIFFLYYSLFGLQSGVYAGPPSGARVIAHALSGGGHRVAEWRLTRAGGGGHGSATHASASQCPLLLAPALVRVVYPIGGVPPKHRFTIRVIVPTMSGQALRRLQHGRRVARRILRCPVSAGGDRTSALCTSRLGVLCDDGKTRSFDKNAGGAVRADAVNCLFLQKAKNAKRIYSKIVYVKSSYTTDKAVESKELKFGPVRPKKCLIEFWNDFYREVNVSPQVVEYVEAYGSAVPEADRAELDAIGEVFCKGKENPLPIGSVISNIGHTEAASGVSAVTKVLLAYNSGQIPANLYYETPHDQVQAICDGQIQVVVENQTFSRTYVAINSHSLSGINCHILLHGLYKRKDLEKYKTIIPRLVTLSGRTESSVSKIIHQLKAQPLDAEEIGLLHNIHKQDIQGHLARGYVVLITNEEGQTVSLAENCDYYPDIRRPVWFVYSGMGSQWAGMGAQLLRIPIFANAIEKCRRVLEPKGVDLIKILVEPDKAIYDNILNSFVGIAAVQIGLTDVLRELNVVPDNIIALKSYADGWMTAEEMILSAYSRGVSVKTSFIRGAMAAVGLGYKDMVGLCPPEIEVACHNGPESSTISGPADVMRAFVQELTAKGIFAKEVPCSNIAYHSRYIAKAGPELLKYLKKVIKDPKPRSQKWVSTSVPRDKWDEPEAKYSSAEYHTNNLLRSVLFEETARLIPNNAVVIEIAPHGLLQAILKRSLGPNCVHVPLTRRGHSDPVTFFLDNIGKLYQAGLTPQVQALYPKISFPVSNGTPMLSHLVEWMHTEKWPLPKYAEQNYSKSGRRTILVSVHDEEYKYIKGNVKDGAIILSEAGILVLVWETLAMMMENKMDEVPVQFCDVRFDSDVIASDDDVLVLDVTIQKGSGQFEVTHRRNIVASGCIRTHWKENMSTVVIEPVEEEYVTSSEIYKMFHLKGYSYRCGGVLMQDITLNDISQPERPTVIKRREFLPYHPVETSDVSTVVHVFLQIVAENSSDGTINAVEFVMSKDEQPLGDLMKIVSNELTNVSFKHKSIEFENVSDIKIFEDPNLLIGHKLLSNIKLQQVFTKIINKHKFIITIEENEVQVTKAPCVEIAAIKTSIGRLILAKMQTKEEVNEDIFFITTPEDVANISFIEHTRNNLLPTQRLIVIADMPPPSGLIALISKWKTEQEKNKINLIITDTRTNSECNIIEQLNKDLAVMTYRNHDPVFKFHHGLVVDSHSSFTLNCNSDPAFDFHLDPVDDTDPTLDTDPDSADDVL
ncbi:Fatty acid synthase [Eumeta japonica]|uniref:Fatty acid synthase n=1 Tax=Eumeta variegata TaxID=151549 RepID=A0A4C1XNZ5_EUMVA|nr:Fatty acid synthase [Eumeta japonica]